MNVLLASPAARPVESAAIASRPPAGAAGLATRMAPPLRLPASHFAVALAFWLCGAAGLVWVAPDLARGAFAAPRVAAVTHLFTLGWITTSILGALYQFLPVALGTPIRSPRAATLGLGLYAPGLILFLTGLLLAAPALMLPGAALFGTGLLIFVVNLGATLRRAPERNLTWWALVGSSASLFSTVVLGVSLAGNLRWGYLGADRFTAVGVHLHVAIAGWVLLTIVGVAHRLLPMFLLSHGASERPGRLAALLLVVGVAVLLAGHHALSPALVVVVALALGGGVAALLAQAFLFFRTRRKPALDAGLRLAGLGMCLLCLALALSPAFALLGLSQPRLATAYVAAALGAVSLFVAGHYYKIVPFLIWFHRFGPLVGKERVPRVADLYAARPANVAAMTLGVGSFGVVLGTLLGSAVAIRGSAALFLMGASVLLAQMITIFNRRPA